MADHTNLREYIELKNLAYYAYDFYEKSSAPKAQEFLKSFLDKYDNDEFKQIFLNTILCPYDLEICQYIDNHKLDEVTALSVCDMFKITNEVFQQKTVEYIKYHFSDFVNQGLIDNNIVSQLSKNFNNIQHK